ncbi:GAF domain-containing protein [Salipiger abyssi]|uniref:GAF domain-containing protein n=1 Tax=Salipiger abyssi TaxID=1250539 RepID=UPI001A8F7316|nr:GAF domain-containing protein [Salipiger abyssi]MBN9887221.1 GAF domain-containing protein [Salipiger abyssi]
MTAWTGFAEAAAGDDLDALFAALCALVQEEIGAQLFTVMTFDPVTRLASRTWSNRPGEYPPGGTKEMPPTDWGARVLDRHEPFVAQVPEEFAPHFPDHELIVSLGCESCLNLPVVVAGEVLGTLNCLDVAYHYTPERVARAARLIAPGALCLMLERKTNPERTAA